MDVVVTFIQQKVETFHMSVSSGDVQGTLLHGIAIKWIDPLLQYKFLDLGELVLLTCEQKTIPVTVKLFLHYSIIAIFFGQPSAITPDVVLFIVTS